MSLFQWGNFKLHSGDESWWRIDCDDMTDAEIAIFAKIIAEKVGPFDAVTAPASHHGSAAPRLVDALKDYMKAGGSLLIVDDVLTTGNSMEELRKEYLDIYDKIVGVVRSEIVGAVMFARGPCPEWITPVWQLTS